MFLSLLSLCALLGYCLGLTKIKRWPIEAAPLLSIAIIISVLYLCAYFDFLRIAAYLIFGLGLLFLLLSPLYIKHDKQNGSLFSAYLTPGFLFWLLLTLIFSFYAAQSWLHYRDEFLVWGPHAEAVFLNNGLINATNFGVHRSYPLGPDLFYYWFMLFRNFSDASLYFTQSILLAAPFAIVFASAKWDQWKLVLAGSIFILFYMILAGNMHIGFKIWLVPDEAIGLFFGGILLIYYQSKKEIRDLLCLLPIVFSLMLLKPKLLPFVLLLTFIFMADQIYQYSFDRQRSDALSSLLQRLLVIFSLTCIAVLVAFSWQYYLNKVHIKNSFPSPTLHSVLHFFSGRLNPIQSKIVTLYFQKMKEVFIIFIPLLVLIPITGLLIKSKKQRYQFILWQIILFIGSIFYLFGLLLINLFSFTSCMHNIPLNDVQVNIWRFFRIYFIGWSLFLFGIIFCILQPSLKNIRDRVQNILLSFSLVAITGLLLFWSWQIHNQNRTRAAFMYLKSLATITDQITKPTDSICIVYKGLSWNNLTQLEYELMPRKVSSHKFINISGACNYILFINNDSSSPIQYAKLLKVNGD